MVAMSDDAVLLDIEDAVATITLNQPDSRNALTGEISDGLEDALDEIEADGDARCVVIQGSGGAFCAGGDINAMMEGLSGMNEPHEKVEKVEETGATLQRVYEFRLPVIAKIDGTAFGAGANLAIACDTQVASESSRISFGFRQVGLSVDAGTSYLLPRIVGENQAKELVLTGEMLDAEAAQDLGLFTTVYSDDEFEDSVAEYVEDIAQGPTVALTAAKRVMRQGLQSDMEQAVTNEAAAQAAVFETHDHEEGASAFMEQREAEFEGR
jgi:enoyl-CoA hydratase/carnithine racemase